MSFDLYFGRDDGSLPAISEVRKHFASSQLFQLNDLKDGGVQFWYQNDATGVYCDFSYSPIDASRLEGHGLSGLSFNLNYIRPSFFAYETMPIVEAFCRRFNLLVEDLQEETMEPPEAARLIQSWRDHNARAMGAMKAVAKEEDMDLYYLPEPRATQWWQYMSIRQGIEHVLSEDIFVPSLMIRLSPTQELFTMMVWPNGIAQFFPRCDYVYVERQKSRIFGTRKEMGLAAYDSVIATIEPLLDEYELGGLRIRYLSSNKAPGVTRLVQSLRLQGIDLSQHAQIASDGFHDVALPADDSVVKTTN